MTRTNYPEIQDPGTIIETAAGKIEYATAGEGPVVLAVHGGPGGYDQGLGLARIFTERGMRVLAPSRPGYLGTPLDTGRTIAEQADALAALRDALGIDKVAVVGISAGGPFAYTLAARHADRVSCLVSVDGVSQRYVMPDQAGKVEQALFLSDFGERLVHALMAHFPGLVISDLLGTEGYLTSKEQHERVKQVVADPEKLRVVKVICNSMNPYRLRKAGVDNDLIQLAAIDNLPLSEIKAPSLIIHGTADADVQFRDGDHAASTIAAAQHLWINRGTHLCFWLSPQATEAQEQAVAFVKAHMH